MLRNGILQDTYGMLQLVDNYGWICDVILQHLIHLLI